MNIQMQDSFTICHGKSDDDPEKAHGAAENHRSYAGTAESSGLSEGS